MSEHSPIASLYRVLGAIGFEQPKVGEDRLPTIAWPDTRTGVCLPAEVPPNDWETVDLMGGEFRAVENFVRRLIDLRDNPEAAVRMNPPRIDEPDLAEPRRAFGQDPLPTASAVRLPAPGGERARHADDLLAGAAARHRLPARHRPRGLFRHPAVA